MGILLHPGPYHLPHGLSVQAWASFICLVGLFVCLVLLFVVVFYQSRGGKR